MLGVTDGSTKASRWTPVYDVVEIHVHPDHEDDDLHDVALFKLDREVVFNDFIRPACLVTEHQSEGTKGITVGKLIKTLVKTTIETLPESECEGISFDFDDESMFCTNPDIREKGLNMHAGVPMVGPMKKPYCMYGILGIAAFGNNRKEPKGFMRLSYYVPWIESVIHEEPNQPY